MKIVYVDTSIDGHHLAYLKKLISDTSNDHIAVLPQKADSLVCRQRIYTNVEGSKRTLKNFKKWIKEIKDIVDQENPDIVHFLYGDVFYRFFGYGLPWFKNYKIVLTFHWLKTGFLGSISAKRICACVNRVVVHSGYIKKELSNKLAEHIVHIEYPQFNTIVVSKTNSCRYWGLQETIPTIACIGNTRYDKGLDILLEALKAVKEPYQLLVAGRAEAFDEAYIRSHISKNAANVKLHLAFLSDEELAMAISAADIIALPYRKMFNGASGPLGEGVALSKCIIGPAHGTLGYTIQQYHLGYTFEAENATDLTQVLSQALALPFEIDHGYIQYQKMLDPEAFLNKYLGVYRNI